MKLVIIRQWLSIAVLMLAVSSCTSAVPATATTSAPPAAPPTDTPTPAAAPALTLDPAGVFPIVVGGDTGTMLGGSANGRWLDAETTASLAAQQVHYRAYDGSTLHGEQVGEIDRTDYGNVGCSYTRVLLSPDDPLADTIGVAGGWDVTPRVPQALDLQNPEAVSAVRALLIAHGIADPEVTLAGVWRVDLDGDGTDEVLVSAERLYNQQSVRAGDYALVALIRTVGGQPTTIPLMLETFPQNQAAVYPWTPVVRAMLDLNGDGRLEVAVDQAAIAGTDYQVYEFSGAEAKMVLHAGCILPVPPDMTLLPPTATPGPNTPGVYPILSGSLVLGGVRDGRWLDAPATAAFVPRAVHYRLFTDGIPSGETDSAMRLVGGGCAFPKDGFYVVDDYASDETHTIGISGGWDPAPRKPQTLGLEIPEYVSAVRDALIGKGLADPDVRLSAVTRIDLEGDGTDEVLITANRVAGLHPDGGLMPGVDAGDYTVILLRKVVEEKVETIPLYVDAFPAADDMARPWVPSVEAILDLNGDGVMEIVLERRAFESDLTDVYEIKASKAASVLSTGCVI